MNFGEIVEPSTRALIHDEDEECPDYELPDIGWEGSFETPPKIDCLICIETHKIKILFNLFFLTNKKPVCASKVAGVEIYNIENNKFILVYNEAKGVASGELAEILSDWLKRATKIITITSASIVSYHNDSLYTRPASIIRNLSTNNEDNLGYMKLEAPNLITGFGATILSYCIQFGLHCSSFIVYFDTTPLDSVNSGSLVILLKKLKLSVQNYDVKLRTCFSNLYM